MQSSITHLRMGLKQVALAVVTAMLTSCGQQPAEQAELGNCQPIAQWCELRSGTSGPQAGRWRIDSAVLASERELPFVIELNPPAHVTSGSVRGVSMAMGTLPLFVDVNQSSRVEGRLLLPACSSEQMTWLVELTLNGATETIVSPAFTVDPAR